MRSCGNLDHRGIQPRDDIARLITRELTAAADRIADAIARQNAAGSTHGSAPVVPGLGPKLLLNATEAGELLGVNRSTIHEMWTAGELRFVRIGRGRKVTRQMLEDYVSKHAE